MRAIGVDLGGHKVVAGLTEDGVIAARIEEPTEPTRMPEPVIAQIARMTRELAAKTQDSGDSEKIPVGVCVPGGLDVARERALMVTNFAGWNGLPIRQMLEDSIGAYVAIENDANAYALGEGFAGAGLARGVKDYVVLTLGTGIGGGVVTGGRLLTGAHGMGGELGHMALGSDEPCGPGCGGRGHFEALCGADALERKALKMALEMGLSSDKPPVLKDLWLRRKESAIAPFWDSALNDIARGIATLVHVFDPELVIIGGGLRRGEGFMELLEVRVFRYLGEVFKKYLKLRASVLDTDAPIFGSAAAALKAFESSRQ
jgi:glucokinase